ncbi:MAG: hypothetical protein JNL08_08990 [Planctomycetes bacterium]|nr:hypothetical protein [Planctomycetota bacterium]
MNRLHVSVSAILTTFALGACSSGPPYAGRSIENEAFDGSNILVTDQELDDVVRFGRPKVERIAGTNQLKVIVPILNTDDEILQVLVDVVFQDNQRQPIGDATARTPRTLSPGQTIWFEAISKQAEAADWQLTVSWNR